MEDLASRGTQEVFDDHLDPAQRGHFEKDIARNFSESCIILTNRGANRGHQGIRELTAMLRREIPNAGYRYINRLVDDRFGCWNGPLTVARSPCMTARTPLWSKAARSSPKRSITR